MGENQPRAVDAFERAKNGAPGWTRTSGPELRRLVLYPPELRARRVYGSAERRTPNAPSAARGACDAPIFSQFPRAE